LKGGAVARRYAKALLDLAVRDDQVVEIGNQLQQHLELLRHENLQAILWHPGVPIEVKTNVLKGILDQTQPAVLLRNFVLLLLDKDRLRQFEVICQQYEQMANARLERVVVEVTTAVELNDEQQQAVTRKLAEITQKEVKVETQVDPSIIGGLVVRINHTVLDGSLQGQLSRLRHELIGG
jgi:F-type H+-transporting ATPase subunit delta